MLLRDHSYMVSLQLTKVSALEESIVSLERLKSIWFRIACIALVVMPTRELAAQRLADTARVRAFVARFYAWYVPIAYSDTIHVPAASIALRDRPGAFSSGFRSALSEELVAQRQPKADLGLNFDPILLSQDPCDRYDVGGIRFAKSAFLVELIPMCGGVRSQYQDGVIAEVVLKDGVWQFANFHGPKDKLDVMKFLEEWRANRAKLHRPPRSS